MSTDLFSDTPTPSKPAKNRAVLIGGGALAAVAVIAGAVFGMQALNAHDKAATDAARASNAPTSALSFTGLTRAITLHDKKAALGYATGDATPALTRWIDNMETIGYTVGGIEAINPDTRTGTQTLPCKTDATTCDLTVRLGTAKPGSLTSHSLVAIEDLAIRNMTRSAKGDAESPGKNVRAKSGLNREMLAVSWAEVRRQLEYKTGWYGCELALAPRFAPTSKTCSHCGEVKAKLALSERTFTCILCGHSEDRDVNAARNILAHAHKVTNYDDCGKRESLNRETGGSVVPLRGATDSLKAAGPEPPKASATVTGEPGTHPLTA